MIKSFRYEETEAVFAREAGRRFRSTERQAFRKLVQIHAVLNLNELREPPGNHLEALQGDHAGQFSIRINQQWRICFLWKDGNAYNVEIADYH